MRTKEFLIKGKEDYQKIRWELMYIEKALKNVLYYAKDSDIQVLTRTIKFLTNETLEITNQRIITKEVAE